MTRIPSPTPRFLAGHAKESDGVLALLLGTSGRAVRLDTCGAIYRGAPIDVVLPRFDGSGRDASSLNAGLTYGYGGGGALSNNSASDGGACARFGGSTRGNSVVSTVGFWPYRRVDSLPSELLRSNQRSGENGEEEHRADRLIVRFDEGMGRMIVVHAQETASSDEDEVTTVSVLDFA